MHTELLGPLARSLALPTLGALVKGLAPPVGSVLLPAPPITAAIMPGCVLVAGQAQRPGGLVHGCKADAQGAKSPHAATAAQAGQSSDLATCNPEIGPFTAAHDSTLQPGAATSVQEQPSGDQPIPACSQVHAAAHPPIEATLQAAADWYAGPAAQLPRTATVPHALLPAFADVLVACPPADPSACGHCTAAEVSMLLLPAYKVLLAAGGGEVLRAACSDRWRGASAENPRHDNSSRCVVPAISPGSATCSTGGGPLPAGLTTVCTLPVITLPEATDAGVVWSVIAYAYSGRLCVPEMQRHRSRSATGTPAGGWVPAAGSHQQQQGGSSTGAPSGLPRTCKQCFAARAALRTARCADATLLPSLVQACRASVSADSLAALPLSCMLVVARDALWLGLAWAVEDCMAALAHHVAMHGLDMHVLTAEPAWAELPQQLKSLCTSVVTAPAPAGSPPVQPGATSGSTIIRAVAQLQDQLPRLMAGF